MKAASFSLHRTPSWEVVVSLLGHGLLAFGISSGEHCTRPEPSLINPEDVMIVQAVALPKQTKALPDKPSRTPDPPQGEPEAPTPPPPPTASDMALEKPDVEKPKGAEKPPPPDRKKDREELLKKARRDQLLRDMAAQVGTEDRVESDPDGVDPDEAIISTGVAGLNDPEYARWHAQCKAAVEANWTPLPSTVKSHPDYIVIIEVPVSSNGQLGKPRVVESSGDASFDRSGELAVLKTGRLPPPPAKYRSSVSKGLQFELKADDKQ